MSDGYQVDPEAMERITRGINQAMAELKEFGFDIEANLGRGFADLSMTGLEAGDDGLQQVFGDFCDRWGWGVRSLMQDANEFAGRLGLSAGIYHEQEQYVSDTLKTVWTAGTGNPYLSPDEVKERSWSETLKDNPLSQVANADYSPESFTAGQDEVKAAWSQAAEDVSTSTVTPDAFLDPRTDWQWGGPEADASAQGSGQGED